MNLVATAAKDILIKSDSRRQSTHGWQGLHKQARQRHQHHSGTDSNAANSWGPFSSRTINGAKWMLLLSI